LAGRSPAGAYRPGPEPPTKNLRPNPGIQPMDVPNAPGHRPLDNNPGHRWKPAMPRQRRAPAGRDSGGVIDLGAPSEAESPGNTSGNRHGRRPVHQHPPFRPIRRKHWTNGQLGQRPVRSGTSITGHGRLAVLRSSPRRRGSAAVLFAPRRPEERCHRGWEQRQSSSFWYLNTGSWERTFRRPTRRRTTHLAFLIPAETAPAWPAAGVGQEP